MICRYCKKYGHQIDKYFKLHGYPSNTTPGQPRFRKTAALAQVSESEPVGGIISSGCNSTQPNSKISKEQFEQLLQLLQQSKINAPKEIIAGSTNFAGLINNYDSRLYGLLACNFSKVENSP